MKIKLILIILLSVNTLICKDLNGIWQINDSLITTGYKDLIVFYPDSSFVIQTSDYNESNDLKHITGTYSTEGNRLLLIFKFFYYKKGDVKLGNSYEEDTSFLTIDYSTTKKTRCQYQCKNSAKIEFKDSSKISINGFIFYKIIDADLKNSLKKLK